MFKYARLKKSKQGIWIKHVVTDFKGVHYTIGVCMPGGYDEELYENHMIDQLRLVNNSPTKLNVTDVGFL